MQLLDATVGTNPVFSELVTQTHRLAIPSSYAAICDESLKGRTERL